MRFANGHYSSGFWIVVVVICFYILVFRRRRSLLSKFAEQPLVQELVSSVSYRRQALKAAAVICCLVGALLALMRPQWGFQWREVKRVGLDIVIAIDTSKSMLAQDVKPNRLERSKLAVKDLLKKLHGDRVGLVAFSGSAFLQCPLTVDYNGFFLALNDLDVDTIPRGGTSLSSALQVAMKSFEGGLQKYKALIIITDGEDHEGDPIRFAEEARKQGIKIFCIGVGTSAGELIRVANETGQKVYLRDKAGNVIKSRLNEDALKKIALLTGGTYVRSSGSEFGLDVIYDEKLSKMEKRELKAQMAKLYHERFQIPLVIALLFLVIEPFISDRKR